MASDMTGSKYSQAYMTSSPENFFLGAGVKFR